MQELGSNPYLRIITPAVFQHGTAMPEYLRFSFVCMTLSHQMNRASDDTQSRSLTRNFYHYRGLVLRSLAQDLGLEGRLKDDVAIAGIMSLLLLDVSPQRQEFPMNRTECFLCVGSTRVAGPKSCPSELAISLRRSLPID
jgi:hypothetical protein